MFSGTTLDQTLLADISLRQLAHVGDAVFHLYVREREIVRSSSAKEMHKRTAGIVSYKGQARALHKIMETLTDEEKDLVRRARNMKPAAYRRSEQALYRKATAFEALLGYLYLTNVDRLKQLLTMMETSQVGKNGEDGSQNGLTDDSASNEDENC